MNSKHREFLFIPFAGSLVVFVVFVSVVCVDLLVVVRPICEFGFRMVSGWVFV